MRLHCLALQDPIMMLHKQQLIDDLLSMRILQLVFGIGPGAYGAPDIVCRICDGLRLS